MQTHPDTPEKIHIHGSGILESRIWPSHGVTLSGSHTSWDTKAWNFSLPRFQILNQTLHQLVGITKCAQDLHLLLPHNNTKPTLSIPTIVHLCRLISYLLLVPITLSTVFSSRIKVGFSKPWNLRTLCCEVMCLGSFSSHTTVWSNHRSYGRYGLFWNSPHWDRYHEAKSIDLQLQAIENENISNLCIITIICYSYVCLLFCLCKQSPMTTTKNHLTTGEYPQLFSPLLKTANW